MPRSVMHGSMISIPEKTGRAMTGTPARNQQSLEGEVRTAQAEVCKLQEKIDAIKAHQAQGLVHNGMCSPHEYHGGQFSEQQLSVFDVDCRGCGALLSGNKEGQNEGNGGILFGGVESDLPIAAGELQLEEA